VPIRHHSANRIEQRPRAVRLDRRSLLAGGLAVAWPLTARGTPARHSLVMVEAPNCTYCARWHAEVGPGYALSAEASFAPLRRFDIGDPALRSIPDLRYTPTFVLVEGTREIGRIVGYPGAEFFWGLLAPLLAKAGFPAAEAADVRT